MNKKSLMIYGSAIVIVAILVTSGSIYMKRSHVASSISIHVDDSPSPAPTTSMPAPQVVGGIGSEKTISQPDGNGGWVTGKVTLKAANEAGRIEELANDLLKPLPGAVKYAFPQGTKITTKVWNNTLELHFSPEMKQFAPLQNPQQEVALIGLFTKNLVGLTVHVEDIQFFIGDEPAAHLFGPAYRTDQPFIQAPTYMGGN